MRHLEINAWVRGQLKVHFSIGGASWGVISQGFYLFIFQTIRKAWRNTQGSLLISGSNAANTNCFPILLPMKKKKKHTEELFLLLDDCFVTAPTGILSLISTSSPGASSCFWLSPPERLLFPLPRQDVCEASFSCITLCRSRRSLPSHQRLAPASRLRPIRLANVF